MERRPLLKSPSCPDYHSCLRDGDHRSSSQRHDQDGYRRDSEGARSGPARAATSSYRNAAKRNNGPSPSPSRDDSSSKVTQHREIRDNAHGHCSGQNGGRADASERKQAAPQAAVVVRGKLKRLFLLAVIAFLCSCGSMFHTPVMDQYVYQVFTQQVFGNLSSDIHINKEPCVNSSSSSSVQATLIKQVQDDSGDFLARITMINGGLAIVVNLFLGTYSDVLGRKLALFLPIFGHFLRNSAAPVVIYFDLGLPVMYVGYVLDGLLGGYLGITAGMYAYAADIAEKGSQRTIGVTLVAVSLGLAKSMMGVLVGLLILKTGFLIAALLSSAMMIAAAFLVCFLPETMSRDRNARTSPLQMLKRIFSTFFPRDDSLRRAMLLLGLVGFLASAFPKMSSITLDALYLMNEPFCWGSLRQGILSSARDTSSYLATFTVIRLFTKVVSDPLLSIFGLISEMGRCITMALAKNDLTVYAGVVSTGILRESIFPPMRAFMSSLVSRDRQGALFAGIAVVECVSECLSKTTFVAVYKATMTVMPGFVFLVVAAANFVSAIIFAINWYLYRKFKASRVIVLSIQEEGKDQDEVHGGDQPSRDTT